jgi:hypothetical protein
MRITTDSACPDVTKELAAQLRAVFRMCVICTSAPWLLGFTRKAIVCALGTAVIENQGAVRAVCLQVNDARRIVTAAKELVSRQTKCRGSFTHSKIE